MATTNFLQFDSQQTNMMSDSNYSADSERTSGFVTGISRSILFNKTLFQTSTMTTAIANVLKSRGYDAMDNNLNSLENSIDSAFSKNSGLPIGSIFPTTAPITEAPEGFLLPNGEPFSPTEYPDLANTYRIGIDTYKYGQTQIGGVWYPLTPDLRGYFLRVHNPRVSGIDGGRTLGSSQGSQNLFHTHSATSLEAGVHKHSITQAQSDSGFGYPGAGNPSPTNKIYTDNSGSHTHIITVMADGGAESRPHNYALTYLIVAKNEANLGSLAQIEWGHINGNLSDQPDLQNALNAKQDTLTPGTGIDITSNVISGKIMTGANGSNAGIAGLVPAPSATDNTKFLRGDGTWVDLGTTLKYKGSVATYADLPSTGQEVGDVYNVLSNGKNYAWDGTTWDDFGGAITVAIASATDVSLNNLTNGQVLTWNSSTQKWENKTVSSSQPVYNSNTNTLEF